MTLVELVEFAKKRGIEITPLMCRQFQKYLDLFLQWNEKIDLSAITKKEEIIEKHFYDSLLIATSIDSTIKSFLDLGSGAGFPGIPLKIIFPHLEMVLLEPTTKRTNFLNLVISELELSNISAVNQRAEDYVKEHREQYDYVSARAVAQLNILVELVMPLLKVNGFFMAMKGQKVFEELQNTKKAMEILHCKVENVFSETLPTFKDCRYNVLFSKVTKTDMKYPRQYGVIKNRPL